MAALSDFIRKLESKLGFVNSSNRALWYNIPQGVPLSNASRYQKRSGAYSYLQNALLYTIVNKISLITSQVPFKLYKYNANGEKKEVKQHEILLKWKYPSKYEGGFAFRKKLTDFYLLEGNAYAKGEFTDTWECNNLNIMPAQHVDIVTGSWQRPVKAYTLDYDGLNEEFNADEVFHWKTSNVDYDNGQQHFGLSPTKPLQSVLESTAAAFDTKINDFKSGGIKGFISIKDSDYPLEPEQMQALIDKITASKKRIAGVNADADFHEVGLTVAEMEVMNSLKYDFDLMCNAYGVNPGLFQGDTTFENQRMYMRALYTQVVMPMLWSLYDEVNLKWVKKVDPRLELVPDFSNVKELEEDNLMRVQYLNQAKEFITANEARSFIDLPPVDDEKADEIFIELGRTPLKDFELDPMQRNPMGTATRSQVNEGLQQRVANQPGQNNDNEDENNEGNQ